MMRFNDGTSFIRGNNDIYFMTASSAQPKGGYLWPSGGWSLMDEWTDDWRTIDPGAGGLITGGNIKTEAGIQAAGTINATNGFRIATIQIVTGSGSPESALAAPVGSLYLRTDGGAGTTLYVKESGTGNTGWIGK